jgi:hypothetical protein
MVPSRWREGERRWLLADDLAADMARLDDPPPVARLLGAFDLHLQARDRTLMVENPARATDLWRPLGRQSERIRPSRRGISTLRYPHD